MSFVFVLKWIVSKCRVSRARGHVGLGTVGPRRVTDRTAGDCQTAAHGADKGGGSKEGHLSALGRSGHQQLVLKASL